VVMPRLRLSTSFRRSTGDDIKNEAKITNFQFINNDLLIFINICSGKGHAQQLKSSTDCLIVRQSVNMKI
jgi:hypothetical protein